MEEETCPFGALVNAVGPIWSQLLTIKILKFLLLLVALKRLRFLSLIWSISRCCRVHLVTGTEDKKIYHPFGAL